MNGSGSDRPGSLPPFEHLLYGLPSELDDAAEATAARPGLLGSRRRKVLAGGVAAVLLTGGLTGAYALHERGATTQDAPAESVAEESREDLALAAELEAARTALEELIDDAREVLAASQDILDDDGGAQLRGDLESALAEASGLLPQRPEGADATRAHVTDLTEAGEVLRAATHDVERAMDERARQVLTEALTEARAVLEQSLGAVADDQVRVELDAAVVAAQEFLDAQDTAPVVLLEHAEELTELTAAVTNAVEDLAQQRAAELQQQEQEQREQQAPPPTQTEPAPQPGGSSSGGQGGGSGSSSNPTPGQGTPAPAPEDEGPTAPAEPTDPAEEPTQDPAPEPTDEPSVPEDRPEDGPTP